MAIFYTCQTSGYIIHDVIGKTLGYPECNTKVKQMMLKDWNFCDDKNV